MHLYEYPMKQSVSTSNNVTTVFVVNTVIKNEHPNYYGSSGTVWSFNLLYPKLVSPLGSYSWKLNILSQFFKMEEREAVKI